MTFLTGVVSRLAAGPLGRTEADIQADIREFLLAAQLGLASEHLVDVALEVHAGGGRRVDIEAGCAVIEVKRDLGSPETMKRAVQQLAGYVRQRTAAKGQRYVGVLTDGQTWVLLHALPDGHLAEVTRLLLSSARDADRLESWLESVLASEDRVRPSPQEILRRLGAGSPAARLDLADLGALYDACRDVPEVQLKRELWSRLLSSAFGTGFDDSDGLFITHTYLVLTAELIAHEVMGLAVDPVGEDVRALLEGQQFAMAGVHGVVEADFFDWPAIPPEGRPVIAGIARRLAKFDWSDVERDVLKGLYESIIDSDTRRRMGEYYTPDWLAQKVVEANFKDPLGERLLDPACGSGTFLFWAVRRVLDACDDAGLSNQEAVAKVVEQVQGMDLHPVAVTLARVTYLLALTPARLADRGELSIPVFLGDSLRWERADTVLTKDGLTIDAGSSLEFFENSLHFPEGVLEEPHRFDRLVAALADKAAAPRRTKKPPGIKRLLDAHRVDGDDDRVAVETAFRKLCRLRDAGRDHIWSYYIRNLARPLAFARPSGQADVVVGNPPWLSYRSMPRALQKTYRALARERGLWAGGKVATHQDLSDVFVARAVEQYLRMGGQFAFVMPFGVLSRRQFLGFRTGDWCGDGNGARVRFGEADDFARVKPPPFPMPSAVVSGTKAPTASGLPVSVTEWTGGVAGPHVDWDAAKSSLVSRRSRVTEATDVEQSPYRARFRQGASLVPRMLLVVEPVEAGRLGVSAGQTRVRSARSANEKLPWKSLPSLEGVVETEFVRPVHFGATIVAYRSRTPARAVVPHTRGMLLDGASETLDEYPGLSRWWHDAEDVWLAKRTASTKLSLRGQIDFQGKLSKQFPIARHRVVYTKSGQHMAACRIDDPSAVIDHKLYWASVESVDEGRYLCAVLNSEILAKTVAALQARGQHNPRDFDMHVFALAFPEFRSANPLHRQLAELGERSEQVASTVDLSGVAQFQKARRLVREALRADGVADDVDAAVARLAKAVQATTVAPDLLAAISTAVDTVEAPRKRRKRYGIVPERASTGKSGTVPR